MNIEKEITNAAEQRVLREARASGLLPEVVVTREQCLAQACECVIKTIRDNRSQGVFTDEEWICTRLQIGLDNNVAVQVGTVL